MEVESLRFKALVFLFPNTAEYEKAIGHSVEEWSGFAHQDGITMVYHDWKSLRGCVAHELCHVVRRHRIVRDLHGLLDEGLASYAERHITPDDSSTAPEVSTDAPLRVLARHDVFFVYFRAMPTDDTGWTRYAVSRHYDHAHAFTRYLIRRDGMEK